MMLQEIKLYVTYLLKFADFFFWRQLKQQLFSKQLFPKKTLLLDKVYKYDYKNIRLMFNPLLNHVQEILCFLKLQ